MSLETIAISSRNNAITLVWRDGYSARFHAIWLRDNAQDVTTRSVGNGQRLISVLDIPDQLTFSQANITHDNCLRVGFSSEDRAFEFTSNWLRKYSYDHPHPNERGWLGSQITAWDANLHERLPSASWRDISRSKTALARWLADVRTFGVALLSEIPSHAGAVCDVAEIFGYVRETNYGRWFDVRAEVDPENLAYTNLGLQAHTDNPYREPVPTLQLLACLENSVSGGESIVVDGFKVVQELKSLNPDGFQLLTQYQASFEFSGSDGVHLCSHAPMISLAADGELKSIRFNNRSAAPFTKIPYDALEDYYRAYRQFAKLVEDPNLQVSFKLAPGELFVVDNERVMHARKAFSGSGRRWLQGCYADKDGLLSTLAVIEKEEGHDARR